MIIHPGLNYLILIFLAFPFLVSVTSAEKTKISIEEIREKNKIIIPPPKRDVPGKKFSLSLGNLYIPDFFKEEATTSTEVVLFFHGAPWCAEQNFYDAGKNAVLVSISVKDYSTTFKDSEKLSQILNETTTTLSRENITSKPIGKICLASFSGGYPAIYEILKNKKFENLITDVVLADSLYAPRLKGTTNEIDPEAMKPFLDFARLAASGKRTFLFSHLYPPVEEYRTNTTTLTASYLIDHLNAKRQEAHSQNSRGAKLLYRADLGNFHILGYEGMYNQDHFEHFYSICDLFRETSLTPAKKD